jgi:hypothetical protein
MSKTHRHTITKVTISRIGLCALCGVFLLAGAPPAYGSDVATDDATAHTLTKLRLDSGLESGWAAKRDSLDFASERIFPVEEEAESSETAEAVDTAEPLIVVDGQVKPRPTIKMLLRRNDADLRDVPILPSFVKVQSTSLSLHEFTYRPAKKTLVQRLGDTLEINFSLGTDHQLDPGHYEERLPSVGLLFERRFR